MQVLINEKTNHNWNNTFYIFIYIFNRRKIDIFITDKGLKFLDEINPIIDKSEELMTTNLSEEEKNILTKLLNKIAV